jgi:hypothetical protein
VDLRKLLGSETTQRVEKSRDTIKRGKNTILSAQI